MWRREILLVAVLLAVAAGGVASLPDRGSSPSTDRPNVVMVSLDTTRVDHLPCYGYHRNTTPNICAFAEESTVFDQAISQMPWSAPSYGTLFTGMYAPVHRFPYRVSPPSDLDNRTPLRPEFRTMAETFRANGYASAAFVGGDGPGPFQPWKGLDQGFDPYSSEHVRFNTTVPAAISWLDERPDRPFFMFVQGYDVHGPYQAPEPYRDRYMPDYAGPLTDYTLGVGRESDDWIIDDIVRTDDGWAINLSDRTVPLTDRDIRYIRARYDGELRYADSRVGRLLDTLRRRDILQDTIVILFADHGENLADRETFSPAGFSHWFLHANMNDHDVHVPLIVRIPGREPGRVERQVGLIDLFPTLVNLTGISIDDRVRQQFQGDSLLPLLDGDASDTFNRRVYAGIHDHAMVRTAEWKLVDDDRTFGKEDQLYHLPSDPNETDNVIDDNPAVADRLRQHLSRWKTRNRLHRSRLWETFTSDGDEGR